MRLGLGLCLLAGPGWAQAPVSSLTSASSAIGLELGPSTLAVTGVYSVAFRLRGAPLGQYSAFPELEGFKKGRKTSTTTTRIVQGRSQSELTVTQEYLPYGEGEVVVPPFQMTVNGRVLKSAGATVRVGAGSTPVAGNPDATAPAVGSLDQLFGKPKPALYQDVPDHAQLVLEADRASVFVGEGVRVGVFFYLLPTDQEWLAFHDFDDQLPRMLHQLHRPRAWEVAGPLPAATPDTVRRQGQKFLRFRLAESTYYPLTAQSLQFPPLALTMTKFKALKKSQPGDADNRLATYKTYLAPALEVAVRGLPAPPAGTTLAETLPVGDFRVAETLSRTVPRTGQPFSYTFALVGTGNLAALLLPAFAARPYLEVYGPEVREIPAPGGGRKEFRYRLVARRAGRLPLDSLVQLVVFNPRTVRYDILRPTLRPVVSGVSAAALALPQPADDPFYGPALESADAELQPMGVYRQVRQYADWLLLGLLAVAGYGVFKKKSS